MPSQSRIIWLEILRTVLVGLLSIAIALPNSIMQAVGDVIAGYYENHPQPHMNMLKETLPDVFLQIWNPFIDICDHYSKFYFIITVVFILMKQERFMLIRRFLFQSGFIQLLRATTVWVTSIPKIDKKCSNSYLWTFPYIISESLLKLVIDGYCNNMIFSGHTAFFTICLLFWVCYGRNFLLKTGGGLLGAVGIFLVSFERYHYTGDIILAIIITTLYCATHLLLVILAESKFLYSKYERYPLINAVLIVVKWIDGSDLSEQKVDSKVAEEN